MAPKQYPTTKYRRHEGILVDVEDLGVRQGKRKQEAVCRA